MVPRFSQVFLQTNSKLVGKVKKDNINLISMALSLRALLAELELGN